MKKKEVQNRTEWQPDARQRKIVELLVNPEDRRTKTDKLKAVGVRRSTFYDWMKNEKFIDYMNSQIDKYTDGELAEVWKALLRKCKMGETSAIKLYFELKGKYRMNIDVNANVNNPYAGLTTEELKKLIGSG